MTKIIKIDPRNIDAKLISEAARVITGGGLVIVPTETVYGIAASANNEDALARLFKIKKRPLDKPFALLVSGLDQIEALAKDVSIIAYKLMHKFWPGPLTVLLKSKTQGKVGLRLPDSNVALEIIYQAKVPLACPSANLSGNPAPTNFIQAIKDLDGLVDLVIDAGPTRIGIESTIVDLTSETLSIVRSGAIKENEIFAAVKIKNVLFVCTGNSCRSVMAEAYLKKVLARDKRVGIEVESAGVMIMTGSGASYETQEVLKFEGLDVSMHQAQRVSRELVGRADIILVMEKIHENKVLELVPEAKNRLFLLKEFAKISDGDLNIIDPVGRAGDFYTRTFNLIKDAVERISKII